MPESHEGLSSYEARIGLEKYGPNVLPERKQPGALSVFLSQLKSPLVFVLIFAGTISLFLGHLTDLVIISVAIIINTFLGFFQEIRANNALAAIKKLIQPKAIVVRDGHSIEINAEFVVPGDICILNTGDKVPADGEIVFANRLFMSEAILTGESVPVSKTNGDMAYMGTVITSGRGKLRVTLTGGKTEVGKIAEDIQVINNDTPIKKQLKKFAGQLTTLVMILTSVVFVIGILAGKDPFEIFTTSVALAVSAIPEGLLVGLTVVLAIGMQRILKKKGLVRNLVSAETLGGVTTICVDKTGTLTEGNMKVVGVEGNKTEVAKQALIANDLDDPVVIALWEWAGKNLDWKDMGHENLDEFLRENPRIDSIPFSAKDRFFASLNTVNNEHNNLYVNGAPEYLLEWSDLSVSDKALVHKSIVKYSSKGMRLVGLARKRVSKKTTKIRLKDVKDGLEWVGLVAFADPVRDGVKAALEKTRQAGIRLIVITGDYAQTALTVLNGLGIHLKPKNIILGSELELSSLTEISARLSMDRGGFLFARTTPEQKVKIVEALKQRNEVVAMMGDGVNDALALKQADIGVVVGGATEVAKESADLVLLDSSFSTIVDAVEEGRGIFNNIRKIILYLMAGSFAEIVAVLGSLLSGLPLPVTAVQILWINLVSDGFPHLALSVDPRDPKIMRLPPRDSGEQLVSPWMRKLIVLVSAFAGLSALGVFAVTYVSTSDLRLSQSIAFATLGVNSLVYVYSVRTLTKSFLSQNPLANHWLNLAVLAGFVLQFLPFATAGGRNFIGVSKLSVNHWTIVLALGVATFVMIEVFKKYVNFNIVTKKASLE